LGLGVDRGGGELNFHDGGQYSAGMV
jgi:hypothetical protein